MNRGKASKGQHDGNKARPNDEIKKTTTLIMTSQQLRYEFGMEIGD